MFGRKTKRVLALLQCCERPLYEWQIREVCGSTNGLLARLERDGHLRSDGETYLLDGKTHQSARRLYWLPSMAPAGGGTFTREFGAVTMVFNLPTTPAAAPRTAAP
jgi:hypothetical protein